jgi:Protein of unknown function (DUF3795)
MIKDTVAYCGLFCESCGIYIATKKNDGPELERLAQIMKTTKDKIRCEGCRSSVLSPHCRECGFTACAKTRGADNCEQCGEFPCVKLREFQAQLPHRAELFESAAYRKAHGVEKWLRKMTEDYSCADCGAINSPYYVSCKKCGKEPANPFVGRHLGLFKK